MKHFHLSSLEYDIINVMTVAVKMSMRLYLVKAAKNNNGTREREKKNIAVIFTINTGAKNEHGEGEVADCEQQQSEKLNKRNEIRELDDFLIKINKAKWPEYNMHWNQIVLPIL